MIEIPWKYTNASVIGTAHIKNNSPCQDACVCEIIQTHIGEPIFLSVVSDGAGSAKYSDFGAQLTCSHTIYEIKNFFECGYEIKDLNKIFFENLIDFLQKELLIRAQESNLTLRDYSCTLLCCIIGLKESVFFQIGDGAIIISSIEESDKYNWVFWPQKGEYENTTHFVTEDNAREVLLFDSIQKGISKIAIFTDGLQHLALHYQSQSVHSPFFIRLFDYLSTSKEFSPELLANPIINFLKSDMVNQRTDDDKTLIIALRNN